MEEFLVTVRTPTFAASIVLYRDACVRAAPALRWCLGQMREPLSASFREKGWRASIRPCPPDPVLYEPEPD